MAKITNFDELKKLHDWARIAKVGSKEWIDFAIVMIDSFPDIYATAERMNLQMKTTGTPAGFGCLNYDGDIEYTAPYAIMCHEHINDGINNFGLDDMAKLKVVPIFYKAEA